MSSSSRLAPQKHKSATSIDTNASGIAESAISFSAFPEPPSSIPTTPITSSPTTSFRSFPLRPNRKREPSNLAHASSSTTPPARPSFDPYSPSSSRPISPYDWHEGASSIDVDATEDRLLSTSFITSLLQQSSSEGHSTRRQSMNSDAVSGISEMTYPPPSNHFLSSQSPVSPQSSSSRSYKHPMQRPLGSRPPPSSFSPIQEASGDVSDDSDTVYSHQDRPTVIRSASISRSPLTVVGVAPATLRTISPVYASGDMGQLDRLDEEDKHLFDPSSPEPRHPLHNLSQNQRSQSRVSHQSTKSFVPSLISHISAGGRAVARMVPWRTKPLPPVPIIPHVPISVEAERRRVEANLPLSNLAARADTLNDMLEKGYHPHESMSSSYFSFRKDDAQTSTFRATTLEGGDIIQRVGVGSEMGYRHDGLPESPLTPTDDSGRKNKKQGANTQRRRYWVILGVFLVIAAAAIGAGIGVSTRAKGPQLPKCSGQLTGMACDLDATCVCTSSTTDRCSALAQSIVDTVPLMNKFFATNYTLASAYTSIWLANGASSDANCARQALLIDTAPGLVYGDHPNRTQWARAALLWNLVQTQDLTATQSIKDFLSKAPWSTISSPDGIVDDASNKFSTTAYGFTFDFASQTVTQPSVSYLSIGTPNDVQKSRVGNAASAALNRMYSYAVASSTQQQTALATYWTNVLQQRASDLNVFKSAFISSSILVPFDAMFSYQSQGMTDLMGNSSSAPFPPPLSCYPGLTQSTVDTINNIEKDVFGLSSASPTSKMDTSCFPDRPIYGVLDVLRLRLPFIDSRNGTAKQAAILRGEVGPRVLIRSGETLGSLPGVVNATPYTVNPREYGTSNNFNHVILKYLSSIPDTNIARSLARFLISSNNPIPPSNSSNADILQAIASIPPVEVVIFGSLLSADISDSVSSFSTPSGAMFYGTPQSQVLRQWTITGLQGTVRWTESAAAAEIARDFSYTDTTWNGTFTAASLALANDAANVGVSNVTNALRINGKFGPT